MDCNKDASDMEPTTERKVNFMLENNFKYHPPTPEKQEKYVTLREAGKDLAYMIKDLSGDNRESSLAITKLEECIMWANASIARN